MRYEPLETPKFFINSLYNQCINLGFDYYEEEKDEYPGGYGGGEKNGALRQQLGEKNANRNHIQDVAELKTEQKPYVSTGFFARVFGWTMDGMLSCLCLN
ncbi:hypothetical protein DITRI_Ditri07aG0133700 [Diplodiscus trichospermus]